MTDEYAPQAIYSLFDAVKKDIPSALMGGILGDKSHFYGYHRARNVLPSTDYSVIEPLDRKGPGWAASALDVTLGETDIMHTVSRRLLDARHDPRMFCIREFFGTVDGKTICGWDWSTDSRTTSDDMTHLWHVHLSVHRAYADNTQALLPVAQVLAGIEPTPEGEDMDKAETEKLISQAMEALTTGSDHGPFTHAKYPGWIKGGKWGEHDREARLENKEDLPHAPK